MPTRRSFPISCGARRKAMCPMSSSILSKHLGKLPVSLLSLAVASLLAAGCGAGNTAVQPRTNRRVLRHRHRCSHVRRHLLRRAVDQRQRHRRQAATPSRWSAARPPSTSPASTACRRMLDMNDVPAGTYTSVQITLGSATLGYLNTVSGSAPTIVTEAATLTTSTVNVTLAIAAGRHPVGIAGRPQPRPQSAQIHPGRRQRQHHRIGHAHLHRRLGRHRRRGRLYRRV